MITATWTRPAIFRIFHLIGLRGRTTPPRCGPMPHWINDPQMSEQLLNDTGLSAEDLGFAEAITKPRPSSCSQASGDSARQAHQRRCAEIQ
ncbi:hypothetical protein [Salipiger mucosus]|uniref:hypothetical protein n=1 Tax=Salipiger mucosus TaxID=263378 RepID=UPI00036B6658|nr:hypothetical protein [Salipiger mucosus]